MLIAVKGFFWHSSLAALQNAEDEAFAFTTMPKYNDTK